MIRRVMTVLGAMMLAGCAPTDIVEPDAQEPESQEFAVLQTRAGVVENAIYDATLDVWMAPDPTPQTFAAQGGEPTHFALKIYPRNEDEQWEVEMMEDVLVQYIPFGMVQLTEQEKSLLKAARAVHSSSIEVSPYTVTYTDYESTDGGSTEPVTFQLPILYVTWPADKPLPEHLEYLVEHVVRPVRRIDMQYMVVGTLWDSDDQLGNNVRMPNVRVSSQYPSDRGDSSSSGTFTFTVPVSGQFPASITIPITLTYQSPDASGWKVTRSGSSAPITKVVTATFGFNSSGLAIPTDIVVPDDTTQANEIYRAANYFFKVQTDIPRNNVSGGIRIVANSVIYPGSPGLHGSFNFPPGQTPWIDIYSTGLLNNDLKRNPAAVGTVLHEIGHMTHYQHNPTNVNGTDLKLIEAFAPYSGWYLGEKYYQSLDWIKTYSSQDITMQARQYWTEYDLGPYSPLFIDLADNFDQSMIYDPVSGMPASVIWSVATQSRNWTQCRQLLQSYVGTYYTQTQLNGLLFHYDQWFD